jgi:SAM-dependent methyltransferase
MRGFVMDNNNTTRSFYDKWHKNPKLGFNEVMNERSDTFQWILDRNGFSDTEDFKKFLRRKKRILDAGCGNGRITALLAKYSADDSKIVGVDLTAADIARENLLIYPNVEIVERDLLGDLTDLGKFDFIYCQEVLHHLSDPAQGYQNLSKLLDIGGEIAVYVYKSKAPVREFVDDYIRERISLMSYEQAMEACEQITQLGKILSELDLMIRVPDVDVLKISDGEYHIQRFFYHFFMKCYWNPDYSFGDNAVINYDWYHPQLCSRHSIEEVKGWFRENNIEVIHTNVDFYGITVRGIKR